MRDAVTEARRAAAERRGRQDASARAWADVLDRVVLPLSHQMVQALKAEGHAVQIVTPAGVVRIGVESRPDDFVELLLQADGDDVAIVGRVSRSHGRETLVEERALVHGAAAVEALAEEQVVEFVATALAGILVR